MKLSDNNVNLESLVGKTLKLPVWDINEDGSVGEQRWEVRPLVKVGERTNHNSQVIYLQVGHLLGSHGIWWLGLDDEFEVVDEKVVDGDSTSA